MQTDKTKKTGTGRTASMGGISVLMVFVMLCLTTFGLLTLATSRAEMRLTEKNAQSVTAYYESSAVMQEILARIDGILQDDAKSWEDGMAEIAGIEGVQVQKDGTGAVVEAASAGNGPIGTVMRLTINEDRQIKITAYHMQSNAEFDYQGDEQEIWQGN